MSLKEKVIQLSELDWSENVQTREYLHANPELSFEEIETSNFICDKLDALGIEYKKGFVKTGIVAHIYGRNPEKKTIALRADIDALPIQELSDKSYSSQKKGVMHACGHDVHTASLLGVARILVALKEEWEGTVKLLFQPAEEVLPGGASLMIQEGALEEHSPESIIGQHVYPDLEVGKVGFRPGMYMASCDELHITVKGKGGHAALPHKLVDPVLMSAHLIVALQQIVSRNLKTEIPCVLSIGYLEAKGATNIIPESVKLKGTFRTMNEEWRAEAHKRMLSIAKGLIEGMGGEVDFEIRKGYPYLENDVPLTNRMKSYAVEILGEENVIDLDLRMTAEDFSYYSQILPSTFYRLGTRNEKQGITSGLHTPTFDIDSTALKTSVAVMAWATLKELEQ